MSDVGALLLRMVRAIGSEPFALIGGHALLAYGIARQTEDVDLLVGTPGVLDPARWGPESPRPVLRPRTDPTDPLDGVALLEPEDEEGNELPVEAIVLERIWARAVLARATARATVAGVEVPVVDLADLVLLKVYAGGPLDRADVAAIAARPDWPPIRATLEERLVSGPRVARRNWAHWRPLLDADE